MLLSSANGWEGTAGEVLSEAARLDGNFLGVAFTLALCARVFPLASVIF